MLRYYLQNGGLRHMAHGRVGQKYVMVRVSDDDIVVLRRAAAESTEGTGSWREAAQEVFRAALDRWSGRTSPATSADPVAAFNELQRDNEALRLALEAAVAERDEARSAIALSARGALGLE